MAGVLRNAGHWADGYALRLVKVPHTFGAFGAFNLVVLLAQKNRLVGALWFADIAVDALVGNHQCHGGAPEGCEVANIGADYLCARLSQAVCGFAVMLL